MAEGGASTSTSAATEDPFVILDKDEDLEVEPAGWSTSTRPNITGSQFRRPCRISKEESTVVTLKTS